MAHSTKVDASVSAAEDECSIPSGPTEEEDFIVNWLIIEGTCDFVVGKTSNGEIIDFIFECGLRIAGEFAKSLWAKKHYGNKLFAAHILHHISCDNISEWGISIESYRDAAGNEILWKVSCSCETH